MKRIEFIGASGVGKTTLLKTMEKVKGRNAGWVSRSEMHKRIWRLLVLRWHFKIRHLFVVISVILTFYSNHTTKLYINLLNRQQKRSYKKSLQKYAGFVDLLIEGMYSRTDLSPSQKKSLMEYVFLRLEELVLFDSLQPKEFVVFCESVIHNISGTSDQVRFQEMLDKFQEFSSSLKPDGVVFCYLSPDENINRRKLRDSQRDKKLLGSSKALKDLENIAVKALSSAQKKAAVMKKLGVPVFEVNMSENIIENAQKVDQFIQGLANNRNITKE